MLIYYAPVIGGCTGFVLFLALILRIRSASHFWKYNLLANLLEVAFAITGVVFGAVIGSDMLERRLAPFKSYLEEYAHAWNAPEAIQPYIRGKVVTLLEEDEGALRHPPHVSSLFLKLPVELRPASPEEVGTVAYLHCAWSVVGFILMLEAVRPRRPAKWTSSMRSVGRLS